MDTTTLLEFARGRMPDIAAAVFVIGVVWRPLHRFQRPSKADLSESHVEFIERHPGLHWPAVPGRSPTRQPEQEGLDTPEQHIRHC